MRKVKAALFGAGQRGAQAYAPYAWKHPEEIEFIAVTEPDEMRRHDFGQRHGIKEEMRFSSFQSFFESEVAKEVEAVLICTQDRDHFTPAMEAIGRGYHILLEKPVSDDPEECLKLKKALEDYGPVFMVCHVLRYTPFFKEVKRLVDQGEVGQLMNIHWIENVGFWHQAHSFVRGNWRNSKESSPMILAKCCHDMDLLLWLAGAKCTKAASFGALGHFKEENAPKGAARRCLDGCKASKDCPYYAPRIYIDWREDWQAEVIKKVVSPDTSDEGILKALKEGPYGRCVYHCDNDVVDHQSVSLEFENGVTASFTMSAFSLDCSREIKIMGSKGEISGKLEENQIEVKDFLTGKIRTIEIGADMEGHGGGDEGIMKEFLAMIRNEVPDVPKDSAVSAIEAHMVAFAAEASRREGRVIDLRSSGKKEGEACL